MNRTLTYQITSHLDTETIDYTSNKKNFAADFIGMTILDFLKIHGYSQPILVQLKKTPDSVLLNGEWVHLNQRLQENDTLVISIQEAAASANIPPTKIAISDFQKMIVYEDADILLVNKPAYLPVHPSMGHHEDTLANYCAYYYADCGSPFVFRCVNRLDRDTSGLVLIAKNMLSSALLSKAQLSHEIHRTYLAIASGTTPEKGTITLPIARKEDSVIERCIDEIHGESAITHYERMDLQSIQEDSFSLLKIQLETGRTHQIRVHMKAIGHPLPGDFLYNPDDRYIKRQALHSYCLQFPHPTTHKEMNFTQLPPKDFYFIPWDYTSLA